MILRHRPATMAASRWGDRSALFARRAAAKRQNIARFATRLADGLTITEAAEAIGVSQQTGSIYFRAICREINDAQRAAGYGDWAV